MKKITNIIAVIIFMGVFSACLKDDNYALDPSGSQNVVEFLNLTTPISAYNDKYVEYIPLTLENVPESEFTAGINYAGPENVAPQDIVVELAAAPEVAEEAGYDPLDPSLYVLPTSITIKRGEKTARFQVKVRPSSFDGNLSNALAIAITSTSYGVISGNVGKVIFSLPVKNIYDGVYRYRTSANTALLPNRDVEVELRTISPTRSRLGPGLLGFYSNQVDYIVDPETNLVTVEMITLLPIATFPESKYDPETKTFTLRWTSNGGARLFEETLTYIGPREE
ncbi:DUF7015 domain-containing protein [Parapedobacter tibetensis]|uniref:DUF7015 domain-containing protein n=1 Tax=Parapedobacter tibetensis TaxID=2972951 RepID=UPI00214D5A5D|nr:DUF1735 domain-containing protein [Parapedobacter tibetensis]